jgi:hypothetical protein
MRIVLRWTWVLVAVAVIYAGATIWLRQRANREFEEEAARKIRAQRCEAEERKLVEQLGGGEMKILSFYASPPSVRRGGKALLCYGVASAHSVRIEPAVDGAWPSLSRCLDVHPERDTTYTLTATDGKGREDSRTASIHVP